ncbi:hypothetical protein BH24DEI1_BH24DEI1_08330 [soil metagenome]|jgi:hypothetical protein
MADGLFVLILLVAATTLERLEQRPFVATRMGELVAVVLGGIPLRLEEALPYRLLEVRRLPGVGFRPAAQTWGELVLVVRGHGSARLLAHEACHVRQFQRLTSFGLWARYLGQWLGGLIRHRNLFLAYWTMGLEVEARAAETGAYPA